MCDFSGAGLNPTMRKYVFIPLPRSLRGQKIRPPHLAPEAFLPLGATAASGKEIGVAAAACVALSPVWAENGRPSSGAKLWRFFHFPTSALSPPLPPSLDGGRADALIKYRADKLAAYLASARVIL